MNTYFDPSLTTQSIVYEIGLLFLVIGIFIYGIKNYRFFVWRFFALFFGVFFFEILTSSFWQIEHLGKYSYINGDISIIMTLTWTSIILGIRFIYDTFIIKQNYIKEFGFIIIGSTILGLLNLILLKYLGIFSYSTLTNEIILNGITIFGRPLEAIVYFPVFVFISYSFYKYWEGAMYNKYIYNNYQIHIKKDVGIVTGNIILLGYLLYPMIGVTHFSYYILLIFLIIIGIIITNYIVSKMNMFPLFMKFLSGSTILGFYLSYIISYFISKNILVFHEITRNTYTDLTFTIPGFHFTDAELVGIFIFSYLLIASTKYLKIITDNKNIEFDEGNMTFRGWKSLFLK